jgi:septal ring factor EnvC (AmiA/AmiB activator)
MDLDSLKQLEGKIGKILDRHEEVRREKDALAQRLKQQEEKFAQLAGQVKQYEDERRELKTRLEKILTRLNGLDIA